jgi:hypothetical protein
MTFDSPLRFPRPPVPAPVPVLIRPPAFFRLPLRDPPVEVLDTPLGLERPGPSCTGTFVLSPAIYYVLPIAPVGFEILARISHPEVLPG